MLITRKPSSVRRFFASFNLGYIMLNHSEWNRPLELEFCLHFSSSNIALPSSSRSPALSSYSSRDIEKLSS
jgi:hypothetical protein